MRTVLRCPGQSMARHPLAVFFDFEGLPIFMDFFALPLWFAGKFPQDSHHHNSWRWFNALRLCVFWCSKGLKIPAIYHPQRDIDLHFCRLCRRRQLWRANCCNYRGKLIMDHVEDSLFLHGGVTNTVYRLSRC